VTQRTASHTLLRRKEVCRGIALLFKEMFNATEKADLSTYIRGWSPQPNPGVTELRHTPAPDKLPDSPNHGWNAFFTDEEEWKAIDPTQQRWSITNFRLNQYYFAYDRDKSICLPLPDINPPVWDRDYATFRDKDYIKYPWLPALGGVKCDDYLPIAITISRATPINFKVAVSDCPHRTRFPLLYLLLEGESVNEHLNMPFVGPKFGWQLTLEVASLKGVNEISLCVLYRQAAEGKPQQIFGLTVEEFDKREPAGSIWGYLPTLRTWDVTD